jgi:ATP-dependent Clp endopeptidase proteolytic subunit ClpP
MPGDDSWIVTLAGEILEENTLQVIERLLRLEARWLEENEQCNNLVKQLGEKLSLEDPETWSKVKRCLDDIDYTTGHFITLFVSSFGGQVGQALNICDTLQQILCPLRVVGLQVYSAATLVVAGGPKGHRYALPNSQFYLHRMSGGIYDKYEEVVGFAQNLKRVNESMINALVKYTGREKSVIERLVQDSKWLNAEEALELGMIDGLLLK